MELQFLFFFYLCDILARDAIVTFKMCVSVDQRAGLKCFVCPSEMVIAAACGHAQLCVAFCDPVDCSPPGSSVRGILQAKNSVAGCQFPLQGIFLTQGSNSCLLCLLHWQVDFFTTEPSRGILQLSFQKKSPFLKGRDGFAVYPNKLALCHCSGQHWSDFILVNLHIVWR